MPSFYHRRQPDDCSKPVVSATRDAAVGAGLATGLLAVGAGGRPRPRCDHLPLASLRERRDLTFPLGNL